MSSIPDPTENASMHASPPATDHDVEINELENEDNPDAELSDVSGGGDLRGDLEGALKGEFEFKGKFALSETFATTPHPGLCIEGVGGIGFPLSERDAKLIEAAAVQAPFGKGTKTVVDTTVRNTFEINPDRFSFTNPAWTQFMLTVTKKVANGLGLPPNRPLPRAELYKLLLYKTGSRFLPHKDTEKSPGMFASLIIVLPSKFEGGEVHVSHGNDKDVFNISPSSEFTTSALAWYTDVIHEVKPVTSGYRLAISYNLVNNSPGLPPPQLPDMHSAVLGVEKIFRKWKKGGYADSKFSGAIVYVLDHEYIGICLESADFMGRDSTLVSNIRRAAERQGVSLYLGLLEYGVSGDVDIYGSDNERSPPLALDVVHETECRIKSLYDLEGDLAEGGDPMIVNPKFDMIPQYPFKGQEPDDEEFGCCVGNGSVPMTYWYRRSALVMSLDGESSAAILRVGDAHYAFRKLRRWKAEGPTERNKNLVQFLTDARYLSSEHGLKLIELSLEWNDFAMWEMILQTSAKRGSSPRLSSDVVIRACDTFTFDRTKQTIETAIRSQPDIRAAVELIRALEAHAPVEGQQNMKAWLKQQTTTVLSSIKVTPNINDVQLFVSIAESEGLPFFSQTIVKQLVGFHQIFDFWVGLAAGLWKNRHKLAPTGGTPEEASTHTAALHQIIDSLIVAAIPECYSGDAYDRSNSYIYSTFAYREPQDLIRIPKLLDVMVLTRRTKKLGQLINLVSQPQGNLLVRYRKLVTPLIPKLKTRYQKYRKSKFPVLDKFLRALVGRWFQDILSAPSKQPEILVKRLACPCPDCANVNRFLQSNAATETFRAAQKRRSHMESSLRGLPDDVTFTTIMSGSPHGLQVTKTKETLTMGKWSGRVESARALLALVGTPEELVRIMGDRYQDIQSALAGTKPYQLKKPTPVVAPVEGAPVASTSTTLATTSGTQTGPVVAGVKRKAEDDGDVIDLSD